MSRFWAMVMPPTSFMPHSAAARHHHSQDNDSNKFTALICVRERRKTVITSGHPLGFDIGLSRKSPARMCKSRCSGMMNTRLGSMSNLSVCSAAASAVNSKPPKYVYTYLADRVFGARVFDLSAAWAGESPLPWLAATIAASASAGTPYSEEFRLALHHRLGQCLEIDVGILRFR